MYPSPTHPSINRFSCNKKIIKNILSHSTEQVVIISHIPPGHVRHTEDWAEDYLDKYIDLCTQVCTYMYVHIQYVHLLRV